MFFLLFVCYNHVLIWLMIEIYEKIEYKSLSVSDNQYLYIYKNQFSKSSTTKSFVNPYLFKTLIISR